MPQYDGGKFNLNWLQPLIYAGAYGIPNKQYNYYKESVPQAAIVIFQILMLIKLLEY